MMTLYFAPGACSLASHIGLEEAGAPYEIKPILLAKKEQRTEAYLKINPRGKVPALDVEGEILVENTAILTYLARRFPEKELMPTDPLEEARCIATMCWFSTIVHPSYQHFHRPERFAEGEVAQAAVREKGRQWFWDNCREIDSMFGEKEWIMGRKYTLVDPYALVFYGWGMRSGFPMNELSRCSAWRERMTQRPAVKKSIQDEERVSSQ
ncbi:MAG TPA: glutathione S-transferase N-terminal domain-containing protein [Terriglobales bacterium]|nr:glutathione S-transferase N-terminal domain-containing protein [Terriglobales bacterium]